ncbi:hypothetical protein [uncultured Methanomethylovorans sp.]|uniref:hypothetical protein n=1 Tax=uncultured Methanomethylovorans sp. TaxID=183759 RepID=UPI002AA7C868|nr:hypothetical protein [uncultured Methanomethylovorans sp.]
MSILSKLKNFGKNKNVLESITLRELQQEQMLLKDRTDKIRKEIVKIETEKKKKFEEGIGADKFYKKMLATEITGLETEAKLKSKSFLMAQKQYQFTTNFLTIKKFEKELKKTPLWDKIASADPEKLEAIMINIRLDGMEYDGLLNTLNEKFEGNDMDEIVDESTGSLMEMWDQVEAGSLDVAAVQKKLSVENDMKE